MLQLESQSSLVFKPDTGISFPRGSDCSSRFSGFFGDTPMKRIPLTQGMFALVDDEEFEEISKHKWCVTKKHRVSYVVRGTERNGRQKRIYMHRSVTNALANMEIDHRDGNGLNNQKYNLRVCTHAENLQNQRKRIARKTSKYKGVSRDKVNKKWKAQIGTNHCTLNLGRYLLEEDAAKAYDCKAKELFGEFANTNF